MNIRLDFTRSTGANGRVEVGRVNLDVGDVFELTERYPSPTGKSS